MNLKKQLTDIELEYKKKRNRILAKYLPEGELYFITIPRLFQDCNNKGNYQLLRSEIFETGFWDSFYCFCTFSSTDFTPNETTIKLAESLPNYDKYKKAISNIIKLLRPSDDVSRILGKWSERGVDIITIQNFFLTHLILWVHALDRRLFEFDPKDKNGNYSAFLNNLRQIDEEFNNALFKLTPLKKKLEAQATELQNKILYLTPGVKRKDSLIASNLKSQLDNTNSCINDVKEEIKELNKFKRMNKQKLKSTLLSLVNVPWNKNKRPREYWKDFFLLAIVTLFKSKKIEYNYWPELVELFNLLYKDEFEHNDYTELNLRNRYRYHYRSKWFKEYLRYALSFTTPPTSTDDEVRAFQTMVDQKLKYDRPVKLEEKVL